MGEIDPNHGIRSEGANRKNRGNPYASCPNCSQTIPRLYTLAGMTPPNNVIAPGQNPCNPRRTAVPTSLPTQQFMDDGGNRDANVPAGSAGAGDLGVWLHRNGQWRRY